MDHIEEPLNVPTVGDWVVFTPSNFEGKPSRTSRHYLDSVRGIYMQYGASGIVLDYESGGPEYPPCITVAWQIDDWWYVSKKLPSDLSHYQVGV